jgi:hypothetical protein
VAGALRDEQRREGADTVDHPHQLDIDQPSPRRGPLFPRRRLLAHHPGVVADQVDTAESFDGLVGERIQVGLNADVGVYPRGMPAPACQRVDGDRNRVLADVGDHHVHTTPDQRVGDRETDAAGAAGHHGDLPRLDPHRATVAR